MWILFKISKGSHLLDRNNRVRSRNNWQYDLILWLARKSVEKQNIILVNMVDWRIIQVTGVNLVLITQILKGSKILDDLTDTNCQENKTKASQHTIIGSFFHLEEWYRVCGRKLVHYIPGTSESSPRAVRRSSTSIMETYRPSFNQNWL